MYSKFWKWRRIVVDIVLCNENRYFGILFYFFCVEFLLGCGFIGEVGIILSRGKLL